MNIVDLDSYVMNMSSRLDDFIESILDYDEDAVTGIRNAWKALPSSWRDVDLESFRTTFQSLGFLRAKPNDIHAAALAVLFNEHPTERVADSSSFVSAPNIQETVSVLNHEAGELSLLLRALSWVAKSSQNSHVARCIQQCSQQEHITNEHKLRRHYVMILQLSESQTMELEPADAPDWWLSFLQFILGGITMSATSGIHYSAFKQAIDNFRVTYSATDKRLGTIIATSFYDDTDSSSLLL